MNNKDYNDVMLASAKDAVVRTKAEIYQVWEAANTVEDREVCHAKVKVLDAMYNKLSNNLRKL